MYQTGNDLTAKALSIHASLAVHYGATFPFFSTKDAVSELVSALLSHRTRNAVSGAAYKTLVAAYPDWNEVRLANVKNIENLIREVTFPEVKAPRIIEALQWVYNDRKGRLDLDFLKEYPLEKALQYLEQIPGVGVKTSAAVLNFSHLRMPALVVDTHHHRVAERTGLVPLRSSLDKAARQLAACLPDGWSGQEVYDHHQLLMRHGQKTCFYRKPACPECPIKDQCDAFISGRWLSL